MTKIGFDMSAMAMFDSSALDVAWSSVECWTGVAAALVDGMLFDGTSLECDTAWESGWLGVEASECKAGDSTICNALIRARVEDVSIAS